jgi:two-component system NtrC family sensor kinase
MESNSTLLAELKKVTRELESYKIELHQTRSYLQGILQNSRDMIFATDVTGLVVSFSKGAEKVLGYDLDEVIGRPIQDFAEDPKWLEDIMATVQEEGYAIAPDIHFLTKKGEAIHCHVTLIVLTNREGKTVGNVGVCRDITQWLKLHEDLIHVDRLAEMGRLAAGVAHEINNPLAVISEASGWATEVIADTEGLSPEDRQELDTTIKKIGAQTVRCRNITHRLLGFTRDTAPTKTEFDVHKLLKEAINFLQPELKYTAIKIDLDFPEEPLFLNSDPTLLEQVFVNLIANAIHAVQEKSKDNGQIELRTVKTDSEAEIIFKDNGEGIPEKNQTSIFELFYTTKPPGKGTGLGLPICKNIVGKLGGDISLESRMGVGTTFTVRIPVS